jgi:hypothetical protein
MIRKSWNRFGEKIMLRQKFESFSASPPTPHS